MGIVAGRDTAPAGELPIINNDRMDVVFDETYCDMPYLANCGGVVVMVGTYNVGVEGSDTQTIGIARSVDGGRTFGAVTEIEASSGPEASWAVPHYHAASGKLFVFYTYNYENVRSFNSSTSFGGASYPSTRVDSIGTIAYKVSTDGGATFGSRTLLTLTAKDIDNRNPFSGAKQLLWGYGRVSEYSGKLYMGFSKCGLVKFGNQFADTEGFILRLDIDGSGNLSNTTQLPSTGSVGLRNPDNSDITEEPDVLIDSSDGLVTVFSRSDRGYLVESYSTNGGSTFTTDWARYSDGTTKVANPRGPASIFRLPDGRPMLWFYNSTDPTFASRNPMWYAIGARVGNRIRFGTPYVLMFNKDGLRLNYGDCLAVGDDLIITMSNKQKGRFTLVAAP